MTLFESKAPPLILPSDNLILPDIFLDDSFRHPTQLSASWDHRPCIIDEASGRSATFEDLRRRTYQLANGLKKRYNFSPGAIVTLCLPNVIEYPVCIWASHLLGYTVSPTSPTLTVDELVYQFEITKTALIFACSDNLDIVLKAAQKIGLVDRVVTIDESNEKAISLSELLDSSDSVPKFPLFKLKAGQAKTTIAFLCFSSGTTGKPKAVAISHYNVVCNVLQISTFNHINVNYTTAEKQRFKPGHVFSGVIPLYHIYGLVINLLFVLYAKMSLVVSPKFDFSRMLNSIKKYRITHIVIVPPQAVLFCKHPAAKTADLSSIRYCVIAGAPITSELTQELLQRLPDVDLGQGYGMTETSPTVTLWPVTQKVGALGSSGRLIPGTVAKVVKEDGTLARVNESGELYVKGVQVTMGYYKNEVATKEVFVDGWVRTGDVAFFDNNDELYIVDRVKELIKVKGFQVAPAELEGHLLTHEDVADVAVIGRKDNYAGELPLAFIVLKPERAEEIKNNSKREKDVRDSIFKHVSDHKTQYKWLTGGIIFVNAIPKSPSGKILRRLLGEQVETEAYTSSTAIISKL